VCDEIDSKFELLVANGNNPKDIQIVSFWKSRFLKTIAFGFFQLDLWCICLVVGEFCYLISCWILRFGKSILQRNTYILHREKYCL
jgi:hypothetical protein